MRLFLVFIFLVISPVGVSAQDMKHITIPKMDAAFFPDIVKGFVGSCEICTTTIVEDGNYRLRKGEVDGVLTVGPRAAHLAKDIDDVPVFSVMTSEAELSQKKNHYSQVYQYDPAQYFIMLKKVFPSMKRVGIVYSRKHSEHFVKNALEAAENMDLRIIAVEVNDAMKVPKAINGKINFVDVFMLLPDPTVLTEQTLSYLNTWTVETRVPIAAFSRQYIKRGAMVAIEKPYYALGQQIGETAQSVLTGQRAPHVERVGLGGAMLYFNNRLAQMFNLEIPRQLLARFEAANLDN